jgi:ABC-2 type transport system permease protein
MPNELAPTPSWTTAQTRSQFGAIAWLRWRIFVNSLRRKGGGGELVGRIFLYILFGSFILSIVAGTFAGTWFLASKGHFNRLSWILWAIFILCQLLNIQLGQPGTTFDPTQLIRFPLRAQTYTAIRLFFGILTPANVLGTLMSLAVAAGITLAVPHLWLYALVALLLFAATNVLFSRMVFAWVDRWLSTRRAREVFTGLIFAASLGIQWANFTFNPAYNHNHTHKVSPERLHLAQSFFHHIHPLLAALPPELTANSILHAHQAQPGSFFLYSLGTAAFGAFFLLIFALRMRTEFRGESLSDAANGASSKRPATTKPSGPSRFAPSTLAPTALTASTPNSSLNIPPVLTAMLSKEFLFLRRHMGILYGLIMPVFLVLILASKVASRSNAVWVFPAAVAYTLLAICPLSYNSLGFEAAGSQFYFLAPIRIRDVMLAKNLFSFLMALIEIIAVFGIICYVASVPPLTTTLSAILWAIGTLAINTTFGNRRSFTTPKKVNPQRMANKQTSQVSALISLALLAVAGSIAAGVFLLCVFLKTLWLLIPLFAIYAAIGIIIYLQSLRTIDQFALDHREPLFLELCKQE